MSSIEGSMLFNAPSRLPTRYTVGSRKSKTLSHTSHFQDTVKWPHPEIPKCLKSVEGIYDLSTWSIPDLVDETLRMELFRFVKVLLWWWDSPIPNKIGTPYGILYESLKRGPEFADELADAIDYSMRISASCSLLYGKEEFPLQTMEVENMDQFFPVFHLIPFERPLSNDIDLIFQKPDYEIPEDLLVIFREEIINSVSVPHENMRELDDLDRLSLMGTQTTYEPSKNRRIPKSLGRFKQTDLVTTNHWIFDSVEVLKHPHESRDSVVADVPTAATLYLIRLRLEQIFKLKGNVIYEKDFSFLHKWLSANSRKLFLMSDQRKCGLTFPRQLLIEFFKTLHSVFPKWGFDTAFEGLSNSYVRDHRDGKLKQALGGPGLGQLSEAISICVTLLFNIWSRDQDQELNLEGLFYNDDQVIRFNFDDLRADPLPDETIDLALSWDLHMESYGLNVHKKKPFISKGGLLLEVYGEDFPVATPKTCQFVGNVFNTFRCCNITAAKEYFSTMFDNLWLENEQTIALNILRNDLIPFFGYEFVPNEECYPYQLGGWYRFRGEEKLDELFLHVQDLAPKHQSLINLIKVKKPTLKGNKITDKNDLSKIARASELLQSGEHFATAQWDYCKIASSVVGVSRPSRTALARSYRSWLENRQKAFSKKPMPIREFFNLYWELTIDEGKAFAPPLSNFQEGVIELPFGESCDMGESACRKKDPVRNWFLLCQEIGLWKEYSFHSRYNAEGLNQRCYMFFDSLDMGELKRCPEAIRIVMLMGYQNLLNIINFGMRHYGKLVLPRAPNILPEIDMLLESVYDDLIILNHTAQIVLNTKLSANLDMEPFRYQASALRSLIDRIDASPYDHIVGLFVNWEGLEEFLKPPVVQKLDMCQAADVGPPVEVNEEDRLLLEYLISQVRTVNHRFPEEEIIRMGLYHQIAVGTTEVPSIFDDDDIEGFDLFGD